MIVRNVQNLVQLNQPVILVRNVQNLVQLNQPAILVIMSKI